MSDPDVAGNLASVVVTSLKLERDASTNASLSYLGGLSYISIIVREELTSHLPNCHVLCHAIEAI